MAVAGSAPSAGKPCLYPDVASQPPLKTRGFVPRDLLKSDLYMKLIKYAIILNPGGFTRRFPGYSYIIHSSLRMISAL